MSFIRLAAVLAACLPVRGLISNSAGGGAHRLQQGSRQARTPLRAIAGASADQVREALITSEAFKDLVERLEERSRQEAGATATSTPSDTRHEQHAFTSAPDRKDAAEHGGGSNDHAMQANHARKRKSEKLAGLRTAVLENPKAREMRDAFKTDNGNAISRPNGSTPPTPPLTAPASASTGDVAAAISTPAFDPEQQGTVEKQLQAEEHSSTAAAVMADGEALLPTEPQEVEEEGKGRKRFRWIGRVASRVSNVGKRVRWRVTRIGAKDTTPGEEHSS
ncbi:unnamed protein product [Ectocarpus sp. CCAP 1310/34]|nr:unnamed protein product [Ectocarpus sp. CCAP 1310/34]